MASFMIESVRLAFFYLQQPGEWLINFFSPVFNELPQVSGHQ
jgi:hypothetical protein